MIVALLSGELGLLEDLIELSELLVDSKLFWSNSLSSSSSESIVIHSICFTSEIGSVLILFVLILINNDELDERFFDTISAKFQKKLMGNKLKTNQPIPLLRITPSLMKSYVPSGYI